ncbi:MAG: alanine racemase [Chloroflexota bacterium]|nr:alanine racemase [Chloroflexota bacterium]
MISLYDILEAANGQLFGEPAAELFTHFAFDARGASESCLFVALRTDQGDGHSDIEDAIARGATGVICSRPPDLDSEGVSIILVKDTQSAVMRWAYTVLHNRGIQVIAVTGSSGRAAAVEAIAQVLELRFPVLRGDGRISGRLNLPATVARLRPDHRAVVLEFHAQQPGDMSEIVLSSQPHVGVVLHADEVTPDSFESAEQYAEESALLIEYLPASGRAILNYDSDRVRAMAARTRAAVTTVGIEAFSADVMAYNLVEGLSGTGFDVRQAAQRLVGRWTPLPGRAPLMSVLAAAAVGLHYEIPLDESLRALTTLESLPGQMRIFNGVNGALLLDASADAAPSDILSALIWIKTVLNEGQRATLILGDLDGLGSGSQREHRAIGQAAASVVDVLITIGADAAYAGRAALDVGMAPTQVRITHSLQDAVIQIAPSGWTDEGGLILIAGGATAHLEWVTRALLANASDSTRLARSEETQEAEATFRPLRPHWIEIDLEALAHNVRGVKTRVGESVTLFAVVKANAYGHGAVAVARTALLNGAGAIAVASLNEAVELRDAGIEAPILAMSYTPAQAVRQAIRQNITLTLYDLEMGRAYDRVARESGGALRVHVKVDTGMGRLGVLASEAIAFFRQLLNLSHLELEGIYTHFASADEDPSYMAEQLRRFKGVLAPLRAAGFAFRYVHSANSAATLSAPDTHFNAVRVGLALYGLSPSESVPVPDDFRPVLTWKSQIAQVKTLPPGHPVGYGMTYIAETTIRIAILPVGFADGLRRAPGSWGHVLVRGQIAPIIGRVSMEKTAIDVTHIPGVAIGDEVVIIGVQGEERITSEAIARRLGTSNYEIITGVAPRAPR